MDAWNVATVLVGIVVGGLGWWLTNLHGQVRDLEKQLHTASIKMVEDFVKWSVYEKDMDVISKKLDQIIEALHNKADK